MAVLRRAHSRARSFVLGGALTALVVTASAKASADEPPKVIGEPAAEPAAEPASAIPNASGEPQPRETRWYGWQPLVADGGTLLLVASAASAGSGLAFAGLGTYLVVPPIIHLAHRRPGVAAGSFALRVVLPFMGGLVGAALATGCNGGPNCRLSAVALGGLAGVAVAIAVDGAALSYEELEPRISPGSARAPRAPRSALAPDAYRTKLVPLAGPRKEGGFDVGLALIF